MMMKAVRLTTALGLLGALAGCVTNGYCARAQPYEDARSVPLLKGAGDLRIPESSTAMKVPDTTAQDVPFGAKVPDPARPNHTRYQCLDQPPPLKVLPEDTKAPT